MNTGTKTRALCSAAIATFLVAALPPVFAAAQDSGNQAQPGPRIGVMTRHGLAGIVTSISGSSVVMEIAENVSFTVQIGVSTHIASRSGESEAATDIQLGDMIFATGEVDDNAHTIQALSVAIQPPAAAQVFNILRTNFGKTWTAGIVTAIQNDSITVQRMDGRAQKFSVDQDTVWRLHDQPAASAMIRVGERVNVQLNPATSQATRVAIAGMAHPN